MDERTGRDVLHEMLNAQRLYCAARMGDAGQCRTLAGDIRDRNALDQAMFCAAIAGHIGAVDALLGLGADMSARYGGVLDRGQTLMHVAAQRPLPALAELLAATDLDAARRLARASTSDIGVTPLMIAVRNGHLGMAEVLVGLSADPNEIDGWGMSPLLVALLDDHTDAGMAELLVRLGADVDMPYGQARGRTLLHLLAANGDPGKIRKLRELGARSDIRDEDGSTPLDCARHEEALEALEAPVALRPAARRVWPQAHVREM